MGRRAGTVVTLDQLAIRYGTDKGTKHDRLTPKCYTLVYEALLEELEVRSLLELGVASGASIRMWADYLPAATIVGLDAGTLPAVHQENVRLYRGRQEDTELLRHLSTAWAPWDVVIDDGSHREADQLKSLEALWPHVSPGGFYAIEDLHAPAAVAGARVEQLVGAELVEYYDTRLLIARRPSVQRTP